MRDSLLFNEGDEKMDKNRIMIGLGCVLLVLVGSACGSLSEDPDLTATETALLTDHPSTLKPTATLRPSITPTPGADFYLDRGLESLQSFDFENAYQDFSSAIAMDDGLANAYALRAEVIWRSSDNYEDALEDINTSLELDPSEEFFYVTRAIIWDLKGEYDNAISDYARAIELNPDYVYAFSHRGITYRDHGEYEKALHDFDRTIELDPADAQAYFNRGTVYHNRGEMDVFYEDYDAAFVDFNAAIADYDSAIEKADDFMDANFAKGQVLQTLRRYDEAVQEYSTVLQIDPSNPDAYKWRGYCFMALGDVQSAEDDLIDSLDYFPGGVDGTVYYLLGVLYNSQGRTDEAIESFELALSLPLDLYQAQDANYALLDLMEEKGVPWFGQPICARDIDGDFEPDSITSEFTTEDLLVYVEFPYQNMEEGMPWKYIWNSEDGWNAETLGAWEDSISGIHTSFFSVSAFGPGKLIYSLYLGDTLVRETACWVVEP